MNALSGGIEAVGVVRVPVQPHRIAGRGAMLPGGAHQQGLRADAAAQHQVGAEVLDALHGGGHALVPKRIASGRTPSSAAGSAAATSLPAMRPPCSAQRGSSAACR